MSEYTTVREEVDNEYHEKLSMHLNALVIKKVCGCTEGQGWPGTHRNVNVWYVTNSGFFIGFNENPGRGWSYPVYKPTRAEYEAALNFKDFGWDF